MQHCMASSRHVVDNMVPQVAVHRQRMQSKSLPTHLEHNSGPPRQLEELVGGDARRERIARRRQLGGLPPRILLSGFVLSCIGLHGTAAAAAAAQLACRLARCTARYMLLVCRTVGCDFWGCALLGIALLLGR